MAKGFKNFVTHLPSVGDIFVGDRIPMKNSNWLKVMAYVDGYIMARFKGCIPFVLNLSDFIRRVHKESDNIYTPEIKVAKDRNWISIADRLPKVRDDFKTATEVQRRSKPLWIRLKPGLKKKEIDGYYVVKNGIGMWSLDPFGASKYYKLEMGTHWCEK